MKDIHMPMNLNYEESMKMAMKEFFVSVKDKPGYFAEMLTFIENRADKGGMTEVFSGSTLHDVKIDTVVFRLLPALHLQDDPQRIP